MKTRNELTRKGLYVLFIAFIVVLGGCVERQEVVVDRNLEEGPASDPVVIGFSLGTLKEERWQKDRDFFLERSKELGASVILLSANADKNMQLSQIENLILQKVDVLVIVPEDAGAVAPYIEKAHAAGIPVLSYDRLITGSDVDFYVSFDNKRVGELQAEGVLDKVSKGRFAYVGGAPTDNNAFLLKEGSMKVLDEKMKSGEITLVYDSFTPEWKSDLAYAGLKEFLSDGEVDAVIAANDGTAFGVIKALDEVGLAGKIPVSGQDAELSACQRVVEGTQTMTVYKPIKALAYRASEIAVELAKGISPQSNSKVFNGKIDITSYLLSPTAVTKENMEETIIADGYHSYEGVYGKIRYDG
jgi:D-xylose transport system substrate-binding protein